MRGFTKLNTTTFARDIKTDKRDLLTVEIGDSKQPQFFPQAKIMRWDNEVNFSIRRDNGARAYSMRRDHLVAEADNENVVIYELEPDEQNEDGGLEIEIELPHRPRTNVFEFTLQTKGLDFFYQPELTEEEKKEGAYQPDNVIGSYAVYHKTKKNNRVGGKEYKAGKAFHIYRPKAIDANGHEVWCELHIDEKARVLTVTVPNEWLFRASYPVLVDPTIGFTNVGGIGVGPNSGVVYASNFNNTTDAEGGVVTAITFNAYLRSGSNNRSTRAAIYESGNTPNRLSPQSGDLLVTSSSRQWWTIEFEGPFLSPSTVYQPAVALNNTSMWHKIWMSCDNVASVFGKSELTSFSTSLPTQANFTDETRRFSIYATYEPTGEPEPPEFECPEELRKLENVPGIEYDPEDKKTLFAEDWNCLIKKVEDLQDQINNKIDDLEDEINNKIEDLQEQIDNL